MPADLPLVWRIRGRQCLVVGGGRVAERRIHRLLAAGASVTVVSPVLTPRLRALYSRGAFRWHQRAYRAGDSAGAALVITATDRPEVNRSAALEARSAGALVNRADEGSEGDVVFPAVLQRGPLLFAVSTSGHSAALAAWVKEQLAVLFPPAWAAYVEWLGAFRRAVQACVADGTMRRHLLRGVLEWGVAERIAAEDWSGLWRLIAERA
ncbi:MAG TPA: bifunctional precorrin-2 dehydrogenase/sirohydrochlorin ferrochelatase, partial [Limnochordia bacterium]